MQNRDFIQLHLIYKMAPGFGAIAFLFSLASVSIFPEFMRVFAAISATLFFVFLVLGYTIERKRQKEIHEVDLDERKAIIEQTRAKTQLLFEQPQPAELHKDIALGAPLNAPVAINGYTERDWEYIVNRLLTVGHAKSKWVGVVTLPSGKTIATFESYDAMLQPFIVGQAIYGRSERESGLLIVRDPKALMMMAMTQLPSPSDLAHLNLVPKTKPDQ